jgi:2-polyprenyl-6-methoxyphenol hydroxylase-like FAD-dependent oxidoreductase
LTFGLSMLNIPRQTYQRLLYEAATREGVNVRFGARVERIDDGEMGPSVKLSTGERIEADLIVGADGTSSLFHHVKALLRNTGIKSTTRITVLGGKDVTIQPNSTCYQCRIPAADMLSNPLTAPLITERGIQSWWGPNTHFICGRIRSGESYSASFFIHPTPDRPLPKSHSSASNSNSQDSGGDNNRRGDVNDILENVARYHYEERIQAFARMIKKEECMLWKVAQLPDLETWVSGSGKVVLLGDAAHAMSPHLGQGAAMSIEDGGVLAECLARAGSVSDIGTAVRAYERVQKGRTEKVKKVAEVSGGWKTLVEGEERAKRDRGFEERLRKGERYEFWRASGHLAWVYGRDFRLEVSCF